MLAEVVRDEPDWHRLFYIERIELGSESRNWQALKELVRPRRKQRAEGARSVALDVLHGRSPPIRLFKVAAKATSKRDVCAGLVTRDRELEFSIWAFCRSRPNVEGDLRVRAGKKKSLPILLSELPPLGERALGISSRCDEIGIVLLATKESHCGSAILSAVGVDGVERRSVGLTRGSAWDDDLEWMELSHLELSHLAGLPGSPICEATPRPHGHGI